MRKNVHPDFYRGVLAALAIVATHDEETIFDEIVGSVGLDELKSVLEPGDASWSGLLKYRHVGLNAKVPR